MKIIPATKDHADGWRALWNLYCDGDVGDDITTATWNRIIDPSSSINSAIAMIDDEIVGFVTYVEHTCTWEIKKVCYLEDLYVSKRHRGERVGVGHAFARYFIDRLNSGEWGLLYAITHVDNTFARRLYDKYATTTPFIRYVLENKI